MNDKRLKFWMVWREGSAQTRFRHQTKPEAELEAERLAQLNPGETFYVLKAVSALEAQKPPIKHLKLVPDTIPF